MTTDDDNPRSAQLVAFNDALAALAQQPSLRTGPLEAAFARILEAGAEALGVDRANGWVIDSESGRLRCVLHYDRGHDRGHDRHSRLPDLDPEQIPRYLEALADKRALAIEDAARDPRARELKAGYLDAHGIAALLDAPILDGGELVGVVCFEQGAPRGWSPGEVQMAGALADFAALALAGHRQRATEAELGARDEWLAGILEHVGDLIITMTLEGIVTYVSPSGRDLGLGGEDALHGRSWREMLLEEDQPHVERSVRNLVEAGEGFERVLYRVRVGERIRWHQAAVTVIRRAGHEPEVAVVARDITELRETEQRHRRLERELMNAQRLETVGRLAGGIAHEFNNLLSVITGNIDLALMDDDIEAIRESLRDAASGAQRAAKIVRQLLAFSRRQMLDVQPIEVGALLGEVAGMLGRLLPESIEVAAEADPEVAPVLADPAQIEQVILNLAINAGDAMPEGGRLALRADNVRLGEDEHATLAAGDYARIDVVDTGTGIAPDVQQHIFEPFFTTKSAQRGTGLGLSVSMGIVEQHGGTLEIASRQGEGTTVSILLPTVERGSDPAAAEPPKPALVEAPDAYRLLVVEDDPEVNAMLCEALRRAGYAVTGVTDPQAALALVARSRRRFDALIADVAMPAMSGPALFERLAVQLPGLRVLFLSGHGGDAVDSDVVKRHGLLQKPVDFTRLTSKVSEVLTRRG